MSDTVNPFELIFFNPNVETRGFEYSASTLCDEAAIEPSKKGHVTLQSILAQRCPAVISLRSSPCRSLDPADLTFVNETDPADERIQLLEAKVDKLTAESDAMRVKLATKTDELNIANGEIERFSQNFVQNILDANTNMTMPTMPNGNQSDHFSVWACKMDSFLRFYF